jgi:superfamily II DNA or RNA helicase
MDIFRTHAQIVDDYATYIRSFIKISDDQIRAEVERELEKGKLWPQPLLQFNPSFEMFGRMDDLTAKGKLHPDLRDIFRGFQLYRHQVEAIRIGTEGKDFVVTSGTGSGKSLTYIGTIFHHLLSNPGSKGVTAVIVYPMNALINSQFDEFKRYQKNYEDNTGKSFPITFGQYTGQEKEEVREKMRDEPPQILLTNYMMLELLLTRIRERTIRDGIYSNLRFLVFDELHTYRGRQGADVAMLVRRIRSRCAHEIVSIGTSATMVSGGSIESQQSQVADVATKLFGRPFLPKQVVIETLTRSLAFDGVLPDKSSLANAINRPINFESSTEELKNHPVAVWLENCIALETRDGILVRGKPKQFPEIVTCLGEASGLEDGKCREFLQQLLQWISLSNKRLQDSGQRYTVLPFKLHQFISQTGSVYTTLDRDENRFITLEPGLFKPDEEERKPIFPNVFSRSSGHPFICVTRLGDRLEPREFREKSEEDEDSHDGYLIIGEEIWDESGDTELLPETWLRQTKAGLVPRKEKKDFFPIKLHFDEFGNCSETTPKKWWGWFMRAPLLFDPTSGTFYDTKTNEGTKLTKLGSEGRSTSTTITTFSILNQLADAGFKTEDQKLLSFTDNRQDAALQAGHFNDFVQVILLRAAIRKAVEASPTKTLNFSTLGEAVFKALRLPFTEFANRNDEPSLPAVRRSYEECFQSFLLYRAIADLRRSWRIVLPNLEQCGLIDIDYEHLHENAAENAFWADVPLLNVLTPEKRADFIRVVLDFCRLEYAIDSDLLSESRLRQNEKEFRERLKAPWSIDREEELREPRFLRLDNLGRNAGVSTTSIGPASALGKYIKLYVRHNELPVDLRKDAYRTFILALFAKLEEADYLRSRPARSEENEEIPIYRLRLHKLIWRLGDGETVRAEIVKQRSYKEREVQPNAFFKKLYLRDFSRMKRQRGEDHTGQLNTDTRIQREELFRAGSISALFCSPTMELGIDIRNLSVVHMRNAPPNPANYAQRSGRAGRSGQAALVFTYCSSYSPHDRHYFQNKQDLVSGAVMAPKLDLCNRELLASHLNAMVVSEIGLPGLEELNGARPSLMRFIVDDNDKMPLSAEVRAGLTVAPTSFSSLKASFKRVIHDFEPELARAGASWYSDQWIEQKLGDIANSLNLSLDRWRHLYRSARVILTRATQKIEPGLLTPGTDEYRKYDRQQKQASHQLALLRNDLSGRSTELSEFYPYRYLASEGFLPGYNFTRLPIRVFLPTGDGMAGEFISRPRSIALREFGPLNIIYHSGRKYRVSQLVVQDAEGSLKVAKISRKAGYFLTDDQMDREICPFTGLNLADSANRENVHDLIEMAESRAEEIDRISCEEEERVSRGFEVETFFSVDGGHLERVKRAVVTTSENTLLNLRYIPAARLVHLSKRWRAQTDGDGFPLGMVSGDWRSSIPAPESNIKEPFRLVKLWTSNLADALYIQPVEPLGLGPDGVITLQHALKRAIETVFQVEPNEVGVVAVGDPDAPNILLYEASEGSLGILSQFVDDVAVFQRVVAQAIKLCRFDDASYKSPASYDDLLSYFNQRDHKKIDRALIKDALEKLRVSSVTIETNSKFANYEDHYQALLRTLDPTSSTERNFIEHLYKNGLRLPDSAQKRVDGIFVQPDFYYEPRFWVFCDGTPHDDAVVKADDDAKRQAIIAKGDEVWTYYYRDNLAERIAGRPDIFRKVR